MNTTQSLTCPNCKNHRFHYDGVQWWPDDILKSTGYRATTYDRQRPGQGGLRLFTCNACKSTFLEPMLL